MAKKVNKKDVEKVVETTQIIENKENKVELIDINVDINEVEKNLNNINLQIESPLTEDIKNLETKTEEVLKPISEINEKVSELDISANEINTKLSSSSPEEVETFLKEEIKKVENIKKDFEKINKKYDFSQSTRMTNWWNGMGFDM